MKEKEYIQASIKYNPQLNYQDNQNFSQFMK